MHKQTFINVPVRDVQASMEFFRKLGYSFNPQFTNDNAACVIVGDNQFVMLLSLEMFRQFTPKDIVDAHKASEVLIGLSCDSREQVDTVVKKALDAGGTTFRGAQDHGFMYGHEFQDPDGHIWELFWMDKAKFPK